MKIKDSATWPGFQAPSSRDVVKSTLLMARNDLPVGSGFIPAFVVIKLMILLGRGIGEREEQVFKEVFSAYLKGFRSPVKLMPKARTMIIHPTVGDTERFREGHRGQATAADGGGGSGGLGGGLRRLRGRVVLALHGARVRVAL